MLEIILRVIITNTATTIFLIVLLLVFFAKAKMKKQKKVIILTKFLLSYNLITIRLFLAYFLNFVPEKWMLGLLSLVTIYFGLKVAIFGDNEEEELQKEMDQKGLSHLEKTVTVMVIASCGADNIGLFTPYFVTLKVNELILTLVVFFILIFVLVYTASKLSTIPGIAKVIEKYSRWVIATIYICLGVFIIYENDTLQTLISLLN